MPTDFVYLKLPATEMPREHGLEDRIDQALRLAGLGSVLGWGSSVGEPAAGPSLAMQINRGLIRECKRLGVKNVAELRGQN